MNAAINLVNLVKVAFWSQLRDSTTAFLGAVILSFMVVAESLVCVFWIYTLSGLGEGYAVMAAFPYVYIIISYSSILIFYRLKRFSYITFTQLAMLLVMPFFMQWVIGGFEASSGVAIWGILSPVGALMILGTRQSTPWFFLFMVLSAISWQLDANFASNAMPIPTYIKDVFFAINLIGIATILYVAMRYFQSQKTRAMDRLGVEQARSEKLLLNVLPASVASRLKNSDIKIADRHEAVTIMFADLVNFTGISADMPPDDLVDLLSQVFSRFDVLAEKYGLEKIKTIGDSYMVAGGVPNHRPDHAQAVANMALEMQSELDAVAEKTGKNLAMRIGINSGAVIAGVIGNAKFSYDLWGDTVNMASRMEQYAASGTIQVTATTYNILKDNYVFDSRGPIAIKGKGEQEAYILKSRR